MRHTSVLFYFLLLVSTFLVRATPRHVYLTWQADTSTTMTINFQTMQDADRSDVFFDTKSRNGKVDEYRFHSVGTRHKIAGLEDGRTIHCVELVSLEPGETYYFIAGDPRNGYTTERKFKTIPDSDENIRFVDGGDMGAGGALPVLLKHAGAQEPSFGTVGGDLAYAGDILTNYARWDAWLDAWEQNMVTPKGVTVPMVLAIGNHEVRGTNAFFYLGYFAQTQNRTTYYSRKFGKNLVIYLLDSGHLFRHGPEQAEWLDSQLQADSDIPYRFAIYHVPLYPSYRPYSGAGSAAGRKHWLPIFDKHRLTTAFEHHDHSFKRTKLLRNDKIDPQGTLYLGDGCWGMPSRPIGKERPWYEAKGASLQHFWVVDVSKERVEYRAINKEGKVFDVYPPNASGAHEADEVFTSLAQPATRNRIE